MRKIFVLVSLWSLVFGLRSISWAAEDIGSLPVEVNGDQVEYFDAEKKVVGKGNVVVTYKDVKMTCKQVTAYLDSKEAIAEGDVLIVRGDSVLKGEKIKYNFEKETGVITNGVAKADVWYGGGAEINKVSADELDIRGGYITTCDRDKPHYAIRSKQVRIYLGKRVVAKNVTFNVGGIPILYLPVYSQPLKEKMPKITVVPGRDKNWGTYLLSSYRYNLSDNMKGNIHLDYRQNKGIGEGVDYKFKNKDIGSGYARFYFMNERDKSAHTKRDRWRAQYRHKWQIRPTTTAIVEYHKMKDKDFIKDYFYREEFERDPSPPTYVSMIHAEENFTADFVAEKRINKFFAETERLPDLQLNIKDRQLMEHLPLFYKGDFEAGNLSNKEADSDMGNHVIRADTYNQLSVPLRLANVLSVDPYAAVRETYYTRELETDISRFRYALYSGIDTSMNFYRIYDYNTDFLNLDINKVRHIFTPNVNYFYIHKPTLAPERLFQFDDVDNVDERNGLAFILENKLQTKHTGPNGPDTAELFRWLLETDYLFHKENDRRFTNVSSDMEIRPYSWLFLEQTAIYDPKERDLKSLNTDIDARDPKENWRVGVGHRYEQKTSSQLTTEIETRITPKWKVRLFELYEFKGKDLKEQEYSVTRDLHCWEAEFTYSVRDTHTFWIIFRLKAFPEMPLRLGTTYYRPKPGPSNE